MPDQIIMSKTVHIMIRKIYYIIYICLPTIILDINTFFIIY